MLIRPRATVADLSPERGRHDGSLLVVATVLGSQLPQLVRAVAGAVTLGNFGGLALLLSAVARILLPPILVLLLCEVLLGPPRAHRRGLCLVPLVMVMVLEHSAGLLGWPMPGPSVLPEVIGALASGMLALGIRSAVPPLSEGES